MQHSFAFFNPWTSNLVTTILTFSLSCPLLGCRKTELGERCLHGAPVPRLTFWTRWGPPLPELQVVHAWTPPRRTGAANAGLCAETWPSSGTSPPPPIHTLCQSLPSSGFQELRRHQSTGKPSLWAGSCFTCFKCTFQNTTSIWAAKFTWKNIAWMLQILPLASRSTLVQFGKTILWMGRRRDLKGSLGDLIGQRFTEYDFHWI